MANPRLNFAVPISLHPPTTDVGAMERLFLLEATTPGMHGYIALDNLRAMRLMRQTIENRLKSPAEYGARGATSETDIVDLGGQFAGFGGYPNLDADMTITWRFSCALRTIRVTIGNWPMPNTCRMLSRLPRNQPCRWLQSMSMSPHGGRAVLLRPVPASSTLRHSVETISTLLIRCHRCARDTPGIGVAFRSLFLRASGPRKRPGALPLDPAGA